MDRKIFQEVLSSEGGSVVLYTDPRFPMADVKKISRNLQNWNMLVPGYVPPASGMLSVENLILEANFTDAPSLPELSRAISLNEFKLKKGFKSCFETTVKGYITKLRMECAKDLFKNKASNVGEVAYKCGYKDVSHFSAAFKLFYGFTPISFRKLNKITKLSFFYWSFLDILALDLFLI